MRHRWWSIAISCGALLSGCSEPADNSQAPDGSLPRDEAVAQLRAADYEALCDAVNVPQGGYGKQQVCADGASQHTDADQPSCVRALTTLASVCGGAAAQSAGCACTLTVGQSVDCALAQGTDLCRDVTECEPVRRCLPGDDSP
ncbi:MAG: hypothetical protein ABUL60_20780 [Myxococcales bacterium]